MQPSPKPPTPETTDSEEVTLVLDAAIVLWATGQREESISAVRQAADCAERAGDEPRAAALRAAASELKAASTSARPSPPARSAPPGRGVSHAPPPPSARAAEARNGSRRPATPSVPTPPVRSTPPAAADAPPSVAPVAAPAAPAAASGSNGRAKEVAGSMHVWVRASARDPSLFLVRVLGEGESAPPGSYEAYLSPTTDGIDLRAPKH